MAESSDTEKTSEAPTDFALILMQRPSTHAELSEKLQALTTAVRETGKKGTLGITITVGLFDGDPDRIVIGDKITMRMPEHDRKDSIFFPTQSGQLSRTDPNSLSPALFKDVDTASGVTFKEV